MEQALYQASISTFEDLGLMFPIENSGDSSLFGDNSARVGVRFRGSFSGEIVLEVDDQMLPAIASNMLGEEEPVEPEMMRDALGEMANVICGNALPAIAGKTEVFRLDPPAVSDRRPGHAKATANLLFQEGKVNVYIYVD
jgi:CheY-specific phosphatase CheX